MANNKKKQNKIKSLFLLFYKNKLQFIFSKYLKEYIFSPNY